MRGYSKLCFAAADDNVLFPLLNDNQKLQIVCAIRRQRSEADWHRR